VNVEALPTRDVLALFERVFGPLGPVSKRRIMETARLRTAGAGTDAGRA
jgi:hypothetical protein